MSLQKLFQDQKAREQFESVASKEGYSNFNRNGHFYAQSELSTFAAGFLRGLKENQTISFANIETIKPQVLHETKQSSLSFEGRETLRKMINRLNKYEVSPAYGDAEYIELCGQLIDEVVARKEKAEQYAKQERVA